MEPHVQYAITSDGVSIAFCVSGQGPPLVFLPPLPGHVQQEWGTRCFGDDYRALSQRYRLIRYDLRGSGLSQRDVADRSLKAREPDLDAVADKLGLAQFALYALGPSGLFAVAY